LIGFEKQGKQAWQYSCPAKHLSTASAEKKADRESGDEDQL